MNFQEALQDFANKYQNDSILPKSLVTVNGTHKSDIKIRSSNNEPLEEYYKWQFIHGLLNSDLGYTKDFIGVEVSFPKGNVSSKSLKIDCCIFDDKEWLKHYLNYKENSDQDSLEFLRDHLVSAIEFKKDIRKKSDLSKVINVQLRPAMKESDSRFVLGCYYDSGRMYLFKRDSEKKYIRYDDGKNLDYSQRVLERLSLELPDPYYFFPKFNTLIDLQAALAEKDYAKIKASELDIISRISDVPLKMSLNNVLRKLDALGLLNEEGYQILIQTLAFRISDEKRSIKHDIPLESYVSPEEINALSDLTSVSTQTLIKRLKGVISEATSKIPTLFEPLRIEWKREKHVELVGEILWQFQRYSLARSESSDLYQMVFYNFATRFKKDEKAQFLTPLPVINFLVDVINPKQTDSLIDPCMGIGDFLSVSFVKSGRKIDETKIYGVDLDEQMTLLAQLNMILTGDGNANLLTAPNLGSIVWKIDSNNKLVKLDPSQHKNGNWDSWTNSTKLLKFDVLLTNPPFGRGRSFRVEKSSDRKIIEMYELWNLYREKSSTSDEDIDLGVVFLENAYRILKENGRLGMILSKSIASTTEWSFVVDWLLEKMRVVGLFELPKDVFAETGVPVILLVAYKPNADQLKMLQEQNYSVYAKEIKRIGYHKKTVRRNVVFETDYKINPSTFEVILDHQGSPTVDEDFSKVLSDFRKWCKEQEQTLQELFLE